MKREFLIQFLNKISQFPIWIKEIIYNKLSEEMDNSANMSYVFVTYKPVLTYKGRCENDFKKSGFDTNIYNMLEAADNNQSISEITINTYLSLEEVAGYFLFCVDEGYFEIPDNSQILNIAGFLGGKYRTGEFFVKDGTISQTQLDDVVKDFEKNSNNKKFGQFLVDWGLISSKQLDNIIRIKEEAKKRFVLDHNEVPKVEKSDSIKDEQIEKLKNENRVLKAKLEQLLAMVKNNNNDK